MKGILWHVFPTAFSIPSQNLARPNTVAAALALGNGSHPEGWLLSGSLQIYLVSLCLSMNFAMRHQSLSFISFGRA